VHDCGYYSADGQSRLLEPGMTLTVEPGLYVDPLCESVEERWRGIGIRIEDDILVTQDGRENLTAAIPKSVEDVEAACSGADLAAVR
ncbi:MAG: M24 family metallopeptidase, partial [Planctomycetota bacterium]